MTYRVVLQRLAEVASCSLLTASLCESCASDAGSAVCFPVATSTTHLAAKIDVADSLADAPRACQSADNSSSGIDAERVPGCGGLSAGRKVKTTENFVWSVRLRPAA